MIGKRFYVFTIALALALIRSGSAEEEEKKKLGWSNVADVGLVLTSGNSSSGSIHFDDKLTLDWQKAALEVKFGGYRTYTKDDRIAVGSPEDFEVIEDDKADLDSERFYAGGKFDRHLSDRFYWVVGASWDRDLDAGIENRGVVYAGLGNTWQDREDLSIKTDYSLSYTNQVEEIKNPLKDDTFPSARFSLDYMNKFGANTTYDLDFALFANLKQVEDSRFTLSNSVAAQMSKIFSLRVSFQNLYQNMPALEKIDLVDSESNQIGTVVVPKKKLDNILKVTLVINF